MKTQLTSCMKSSFSWCQLTKQRLASLLVPLVHPISSIGAGLDGMVFDAPDIDGTGENLPDERGSELRQDLVECHRIIAHSHAASVEDGVVDRGWLKDLSTGFTARTVRTPEICRMCLPAPMEQFTPSFSCAASRSGPWAIREFLTRMAPLWFSIPGLTTTPHNPRATQATASPARSWNPWNNTRATEKLRWRPPWTGRQRSRGFRDWFLVCMRSERARGADPYSFPRSTLCATWSNNGRKRESAQGQEPSSHSLVCVPPVSGRHTIFCHTALVVQNESHNQVHLEVGDLAIVYHHVLVLHPRACDAAQGFWRALNAPLGRIVKAVRWGRGNFCYPCNRHGALLFQWFRETNGWLAWMFPCA